MSVEFDSPANRIISQFAPKDKFGIQLLPDIAFLRQLAIQGRMRYFQGSTSSIEAIVSFVPNEGETFFFLKGTFYSSAAGGSQVNLSNNGNVRINQRTTLNTPQDLDIGIDSLVGDNIKAYTIDNLAATFTAASMIGWVENTSRIRDVTT